MRLLILTIGLLLINCTNNTQTDNPTRPATREEVNTTFWESVEMNLDGQYVKIYNNGDSGHFEIRRTYMDEKGNWTKKADPKKESFILSKTEKDSIFKWTRSLVMEPASPIHRCTDYAGHLLITIDYGTIWSRKRQSCEYSSVCDWYLVSEETKAMRTLLKTKIKSLE